MKKIIFIVISFFILSFSLIFIFKEKNLFSENENRYLASMPDFNLDNITSGSYVKGLEDFITDSFPLRDQLVGFKTKIEKLIGKQSINDIYFGQDGFMLTRYQKIDFKKIIDTINEFSEKNNLIDINLMLVPSSISIYDDKLPSFAITDSEKEVIDNIYKNVTTKNIDVFDSLKKLKESQQVFYKTDHHWTTFGAYEAYLDYCMANNIEPKKQSEFNILKVTDSFYGTLYSKTNNYDTVSDDIYLFQTKTNYLVNYESKKIITNTLYDMEYLKTKDKYSVFLSNNHPLLTIMNEDIDNDLEILVIKDSYGNSFIPFLCEHYKKVHVVDLRYNLNSMSDYLKKNININKVLILYNINTIDKDSSLYNLR